LALAAARRRIVENLDIKLLPVDLLDRLRREKDLGGAETRSAVRLMAYASPGYRASRSRSASSDPVMRTHRNF
jgi:hypothetical protein